MLRVDCKSTFFNVAFDTILKNDHAELKVCHVLLSALVDVSAKSG